MGLCMTSNQARLARLKAGQRPIFESIRCEFEARYRELSRYDIAEFVTPFWKKFNAQLEQSLLPAPPFSFLKDPVIIFSMFMTAGGHCLEEETRLLESWFSKERLKEILVEDYAGEPLLFNAEYLTSHNSIHHLHHLARWSMVTGLSLERNKTVVEWGGGYGNLAKIYRRLAPGTTYVIIDTPIFTCLQWLYLRTVLGEKEVHLIGASGPAIRKGRVNLISLGQLDRLKLKADLFISTWALSESATFAMNWVKRHKWFGAQSLLLAYQNSGRNLPDAGSLGLMAAAKGAKIEDISFLPGNHYAFK